MAHPEAPLPRVSPRLAAILRIAADLRDLPRADFKARLRAMLTPTPLSRPRPARAAKTARRAKAVSPTLSTATPCLIVRDAPRAIEFYRQAFGATELMRLADPGTGKLWHAEVRVGEAVIALAEEDPAYNLSPQSLGGSPVIVQLNVADVDVVAREAVAAGAEIVFPVADQFYGDRAGRLKDPFGHIWIVATHKEDVSMEEMRRRAEAFTRAHAPESVPTHEPTRAPEPRREVSHTLTPYLQVDGAAKLIDFLKRAFGAEERFRATRPDGTIGHAEVRIDDSWIELADATAEYPPNPTAIHLYVPRADATYASALRAGATSIHTPVDQEYGDREASVKDPFGNHWYIATPLKPAKGRVAHIPEGLRSVTPYLHPHGAPQLIDFLKQAFGAEEMFRAQSEGVVQHAKVRIGDSVIEMGEAHGPYQPMPPAIHLRVDDADVSYRHALQAGATSMQEPTDQDYGERNASVKDPFGNIWYIATERGNAPSEPAAPSSSHTVMPFLYIRDAVAALEFYKRVLGATELMREVDPSGIVSHAQIKAGDAQIMIRDPSVGMPTEYATKGLARTARELGGTPVHLYLYVDDVDEVFARALAAGATVVDALGDKEWGDRCGGIQDPFGQIWYLATPLKDAHPRQ